MGVNTFNNLETCWESLGSINGHQVPIVILKPRNYDVILLPGIIIQGGRSWAQTSAPLLYGLCNKHTFMSSQITAGSHFLELSNSLGTRQWHVYCTVTARLPCFLVKEASKPTHRMTSDQQAAHKQEAGRCGRVVAVGRAVRKGLLEEADI